MATSSYPTFTIYRRLLREARPYWPHIAIVFLLNLLATPLKLLTPVPLKIAVDSVLGNEPLPRFIPWIIPPLAEAPPSTLLIFACVMLVILALFLCLMGLAVWLLHTYTGEKLLLNFRSRLFRHIQDLPFTYHDTKGTTDSTYRIQYDAPAIQWVTLDGIQPLITAAVTVVAMLCVIAGINWQLALVAIAAAPVLFTLTYIWGGRMRREWRQAKALQSSAMSAVQESLGSLRVVKAFGAEDREQSRFAERATEGLQGQMKVAKSQGLYELLTGLTLAIGTAATLFLGIRNIQASVLTLGEFLLIWAYLAQLYGPLQTIGKKMTTLQGAMASADRALSVLDEEPKVFEKPNAKPIKRCRGNLVFDNVDFSYIGEERILKNLSFDVPQGTCVGIVGTTGAGKSTLAAMLMRFYDPTKGRIRLDGVDLRDYRVEDLRDQFSIVLQESVLFSTSIAENIAYARPDADAAEIEAAAKAANAHQFIQQTTKGYDTQVGERGMKLSGGERQRIALARAFLRDSPILILDEPTSAVDFQTEAVIVEALQRLITDRTTFLITHRTSLLELCQLVLRIEQEGALLEAPDTLSRDR